MLRLAMVPLLVLLMTSWAQAALEQVWSFQPPGEQFDASVGLADLNGDGRLEIIAPTIQGAVLAIDCNGQELWRWRQPDVISAPPTVADLSPRPGLEVVVLTNTGHVYCLSGSKGEPIWDYKLSGSIVWGGGSIPAVDLDGDGKLELVTGDARGQIVAFRGDGSLFWSSRFERGLKSAMAVGDIDGDGSAEILFGAAKTALVCLDAKGKERWRLGEEVENVGAPILADMDGDGKPEVLTGIRDGVCLVGADGQTRWCSPTKGVIDSGLSVADLNEDGRLEILVADLAGQLSVFNDRGEQLWTADAEARVRRSPSVADLDGDGRPEIVVAGYSGRMYVWDSGGRLLEKMELGGGTNASPAIADLQADGRLTVICPVTTGSLNAYRWAGGGAGSLFWPQYRFDSRNTALAAASKPSGQPRIIDLQVGRAYVGRNEFSAVIENPKGEKLDVILEIIQGEQHIRKVTTSSEARIQAAVPYTMGARAESRFQFRASIVREGKMITQRTRDLNAVPFAAELAATGAALLRLEDLAVKLPPEPASDVRREVLYWRATLPSLREQAAASAFLSGEELAGLGRQLLLARNRTSFHLTLAEQRVKAKSALLLSAANPMADFGGVSELEEGRIQAPDMIASAFAGEIESAALNVFNLKSSSLTARVEIDPLLGPEGVKAPRQTITLREAVATRTQMADLAADALPRLNQGRTLVLPGYEGRQLYFEIDTRGLRPGLWTTTVRLRGLDVEATETTAPLKIQIWSTPLPGKQTIGLCHWGYVQSSFLKDQPEAALQDQIRHGTNVFVDTYPPKASFDQKGKLIGDLDYSAHDAYLDQYGKHGLILFYTYDNALKGPGEKFSEPWNRAHVAYLRRWVQHLKARGMDYEDWALYTIDEPGLKEGLVDLHIRLGKLAREADPRIRIYTDPVGDASLDDLKAMAPYTDIWCPARNGIVNKPDQSKLDFLKSTGKPVFLYECQGNAKHRSPIGYYRGQAWLAWIHDLKSLGFWTYCTSTHDPWFNDGEPDYLLIYQGEGVVPSRRWHAVRDGIEDHAMLTLLRERAQRAAAAALQPEAVAGARQLLEEKARQIARFCGLDEEDEVPGVGGLAEQRRVEDRRRQKINDMRTEMARLLELLK